MLRCRRSLGERRSDDLAESAHGAVTARSRANADARLVAAHEFFRKGQANVEGWSMLIAKGRNWESAYRDRRRHDKVVRSTHVVNCTGSCSWNVYVKDGLITWESQAVGGFVAMFLYLRKLLTAEYDLTKADAGARAAGFALLAVVGRPLGGWLSDRVGATASCSCRSAPWRCSPSS
jgi:respiratory nitrate reductase alpha subunit-like protein